MLARKTSPLQFAETSNPESETKTSEGEENFAVMAEPHTVTLG